MSIEDYRNDARALLARFSEELVYGDRNALIENYAEDMERMHNHYAHLLLNDVIEDARTRLDARLSPDPVRQTIATVQSTVQDIWKTLSETFNPPSGPNSGPPSGPTNQR
jgi:hypothetical protein